ncbi:MAG: hypothetical protein Q4F82_12370 [bacterium]|nr:hypothetical protein [bacterium]
MPGACRLLKLEFECYGSDGRKKAFEFHGSYMYIVEFMAMAERTFGKKNMLPLEEMEIENQCGYIFKGSTNQMEYIGDSGGQTSLFTNS